MKKFSKTTVILWVLAVLFFIGSFPLLFDGKISAFVGGLVIATVLGFFGWKQRGKKSKTIYYVYVIDSSDIYHYNPECGAMKNAKLITISQAQRLGKKPCGGCTVTGSGYSLIKKEK